MQITKFYKKPDDEMKYVLDLQIQDKYPLYAVALDKKDAKTFRQSRDMSKFIEVRDDIDDALKDETLESINKNPSIRSAVLEERKLKTFINKYEKDMEKRSVSLLMTYREYCMVSNADEEGIVILSPLWWDQWAPEAYSTRFLKDKYIKALQTLDFDLLRRFIVSDKFYDGTPNSDKLFDDDYDFIDWEYDELAIFIHMFGWSLDSSD